MALKFLNKKGWHTGSLRNIENVWKAEQKHEAEERKLEELKKQIQEERVRAEYRLIQEQAGYAPKQEKLEFLYDSGLSVGKGTSSGGFKELELDTKPPDPQASTSGAEQQSSGLGALFEEKPQSANDSWRKLHSDPLLLIRKREQEALARVKNNPVQMAIIRKSVEATKLKDGKQDGKGHKKDKHHKKSKHSSSKHHRDSDTTSQHEGGSKGRRSLNYEETKKSSDDSVQRDKTYNNAKYRDPPFLKSTKGESSSQTKRDHEDSHRASSHSRRKVDADYYNKDRGDRSNAYRDYPDSSNATAKNETNNRRRKPIKLSEEERAARLQEMQMDAELHEEQRWKRLKTAEESDAREATEARNSSSKNFLDDAQRSIYGTERGGSSTIEESVRRRSYYSQNRSEATERNAFRR